MLPPCLLVVLLLVACSSGPVAEGEGEGEQAGEGEGEQAGEGEGEQAGEGEGEQAGEGEGEQAGEGEGEGESGFGFISGSCGTLDDELTSATPSFFDNTIEFGSNGFDDPAERPELTEGGVEMLVDGNAGGSSLFSEVFAFEVLARCEGASLYKTETEVLYTAAGSITDLVIDIDSQRYGVSVVRSFVFPPGTPLSLTEATMRLQGKLDDILVSSANVSDIDAWQKQILAVVAPEPDHVEVLREAWLALDPATQADTVIYVTVTNGADDFIY